MKRASLAIALFMAACEPTRPPQQQHSRCQIATDIAQRVAASRTVIDYDRALLDRHRQAVVAKLIEASKPSTSSIGGQSPSAIRVAARSWRKRAPGVRVLLANKGPWTG